MSDWKLDDKEWVKQRKRDWREVKFNINAFSEGWMNIDKEQQKQVEKYFLTGDLEALKSIYLMLDSLLLELWVYPSRDIDVLKLVLKRHTVEKKSLSDLHLDYVESFNRMTVYSSNVSFKGVSPLNGRDRLIDLVLMPQTLEEELGTLPITDHKKTIRRRFLGFSGRFEDYLVRTEFIKEDICQYKVQYWRDAIKLGFDAQCSDFGVHKNRPEFEWLIQELDSFDPKGKDERQIKLAEEIKVVLAEPEIAEIVGEKIAEIRANT